MTPSENQIDILINYKSNFEKSIQDAQSRITDLSKSISDGHNRFNEIAKSRTKSANSERKAIKEVLVGLEKELDTTKRILTAKSQANEQISKGVMTQRNALDTMIKDTEKYNSRASNIIKERLTKQATEEENTISKMLQEQQALTNSIISSNQARFNSEAAGNKRVVDDIVSTRKAGEQDIDKLIQDKVKAQNAINNSLITDNQKRFNEEVTGNKRVIDDMISTRKQEHAQNMNQWRQETDTKIAGRKAELASLKQNIIERNKIQQSDSSNSFEGSFTSGSSFGHKIGTTMQYAAAGTAIFAVAGALKTLASAALDADLNMRTMAAVLNLSVPMAKTLDESVRKLGETYGGTTVEIEKVALALGRAGVATKDIVKATEITLAMARLTGDTFEQSASAVISYQQVFGNTTSIEVLGDKLAYVANASRLSTQDIGTFSNYALAAAKDVGLTEDAVGGLAAAFSNAGVNASTIGTQIRRFTSLLSDNSTAVTDFYRGIGVNQANLLASLKQGGETSNKALLAFIKTLKAVDDTKFTHLTGNMDLLAANSLQLMRNNSSNITKFVNDLQNNATGQLDRTKIILESYLVTFESLWNKLTNFSTKAANNQIDIMNDLLSRADIAISIVTNGMNGLEVAGKKSVAFQMSKDIEKLADNEQKYNDKQIDFISYMEKKVALTKAIDTRKKELLSTTAKELTQDQQLEKAKENQLTILNALKNPKLGNNELNTLHKLLKDVDSEILKLSENAKTVKVAPILQVDATDLQKQSDFIKSLVDAKKDTTVALSNFNTEYNKTLSKNKENVANSVASLINYPKAQSEVSKALVDDTATSISLLLQLSQKLTDENKQISDFNKANPDKAKGGIIENNNALNVVTDILKIKQATLGVETLSNNLETKQVNKAESLKKAEEAKQRSAESAQHKAEVEAARRQKITDDRVTAETKIQELTKQILGDETDSISKAQSRLGVDASLLSLAYERYTLSIGTKDEEKRKTEYAQAEVKYLETSVAVISQLNKKEQDRKSLLIDLNSGLSQAIEGEQVRLGIIEKATDSEYEKLRVKIEQGKLDGLLFGDELARQEARLAQLDKLQHKRKDIHTLAMEYQRELTDQETAGYIAAKAGLASLESGMLNFFDITSQGWLDWHALASDVLKSIYKQLLQELVIKQLVSGIAGGIGSFFAPTASIGANIGSTAGANAAALGIQGSASIFNANGGAIPTKGFALGGMLNGGTGIRDDIYLGNVSGTRVFAMGGEFITRKDSVNPETKGTLDYINKTGSVPNSGSQVNIPVKINIENNTGQNISADMIESMTKPNDKGEYEKVVNIILKASQTDARVRSILRGK